jgi:hypothetical protein
MSLLGEESSTRRSACDNVTIPQETQPFHFQEVHCQIGIDEATDDSTKKASDQK